jgi:hypothetical protein
MYRQAAWNAPPHNVARQTLQLRMPPLLKLPLRTLPRSRAAAAQESCV